MRTFISFASEDAWYRDRFIEHQRRRNCPYSVIDNSAHTPFDERWKRQMRERILRSEVTVMFIGPTTHLSENAIWEVETSLIEGIPAFGLWIHRDLYAPPPRCFHPEHIMFWEEEEVAKMFELANGYRIAAARRSGRPPAWFGLER